MTKEEQLKDFEEYFAPYSDPNCGLCHGRGYQGFNQIEERYIPCTCLIKNLAKEQAERNQEDAGKKGVIEEIRHRIGLN